MKTKVDVKIKLELASLICEFLLTNLLTSFLLFPVFI